MEATKKRILIKAISHVQHKLAVADARLLAHRGIAVHDVEFAEALEAVAVEARKLADAFAKSIGAEAVLAEIDRKTKTAALPRPKLLARPRPGASS